MLAPLNGFVECPWPPVSGGPPSGWLLQHAIELCWRTRVRDLDRLSCSGHGTAHAAAIEDTSGGTTRRFRTPAGAAPWNPAPPATHPIRYAFGHTVAQQLVSPAFDPDDRPVTPRADDGSGSVALLRSASPQAGWTGPQAVETLIASEVDGAAPVEISFVATPAYRYPFTGQLEGLAIRTDQGTRTLPGRFRIDAGAIYPPDVVLLEASDGVATARALPRSIDGGRTGHLACWSVALGATDRLACSVADVPGTSARLEDIRQSATHLYR